MVIGIVLVTLVLFIIVDLTIRYLLKRYRDAKLHEERKKALDIGLKLQIADEATTLKRVKVDNPKAKIIAVDDEEIILDSFRKILVLAGYSVDTVEKGPEALMLVKKNDYDFVFTDLKMPDMDGVEVTKAVKHLRPDIDVVMITGYATIETAVDVMKFGAMDYVQKPFTEDELVDFVNKLLIKRMDRIEKSVKPSVHLITPSIAESASKHDFNVPVGVFISEDHTWSSFEPNGLVRIGIDDFVQKIIGTIDDMVLPEIGKKVKKGETLFTLIQGDRKANFLSPISGVVRYQNANLADNINLISIKPYEHGWLCYLEATNLGEDIKSLRIGADAVTWYKNEIDRYINMINTFSSKPDEQESIHRTNQEFTLMSDKVWKEFTKTFLHA